MHRVVIVGAGFGGLRLRRGPRRQVAVHVTLIDQRNYQTFQPLLYEVATAGLDSADVAYPMRAAIGRDSNIHFRLGTVTGVDWDERTVCFAGVGVRHDATSEGCADDIPFDSLIVATGSVVNFFGVPGAAEHAHPLYTLEDARHLRDHILVRLEEADGESAHSSDGTLNFVVVGGGPTGVEVSGAIAELLDMSISRDGFRFDRSGRSHRVDRWARPRAHTRSNGRHNDTPEKTLRGRTVELELGQTVVEGRTNRGRARGRIDSSPPAR